MNSFKNKEKDLKEAKQNVDSWGSKFKFSTISLVFFTIMSVIYGLDPFFGNIPTIVFGVFGVVFIQQTIRSYNYLKFSKTTYNAIELMYDMVENFK
jgi:hypothetical protein